MSDFPKTVEVFDEDEEAAAREAVARLRMENPAYAALVKESQRRGVNLEHARRTLGEILLMTGPGGDFPCDAVWKLTQRFIDNSAAEVSE